MSETFRGKPGKSFYAGFDSSLLESPDQKRLIEIKYVGEPPNGDAFHSLVVDGLEFPGFVWAGMFAWSTECRYFCCSWMPQKFDRKTLVIDCEFKKYVTLPDYFYDFKFQFPNIVEINEETQQTERIFVFTGRENWQEVTALPKPNLEWIHGENLEDWYQKLANFYVSKGLSLEMAESNVSNIKNALSPFSKERKLLAIKQILGLPLKT